MIAGRNALTRCKSSRLYTGVLRFICVHFHRSNRHSLLISSAKLLLHLAHRSYPPLQPRLTPQSAPSPTMSRSVAGCLLKLLLHASSITKFTINGESVPSYHQMLRKPQPPLPLCSLRLCGSILLPSASNSTNGCLAVETKP